MRARSPHSGGVGLREGRALRFGRHGGRELRALRALHREVWGEKTYAAKYAARTPRTSSGERTRAIGFGTIALGALFVLTGIAPAVAHATQPNPEHKVTLCHRTDAYSNPYVRINVDVASVLHEGHDSHNGPVFYSSIPKHTKWGDIIPPFDYGPNEQYAGQNWTPQGISVFDDGCNMPHPTTTTTTCPPKTTTTTTTTLPTTTTTTTQASTTSTAPTTTTTVPGGSTTTTSSTEPSTTTSSVATTSTTISTVTTAGNTTTTAPGATTTTLSDNVTMASSPTTAPPGTGTSLPFTGGSSNAMIAGGFVLVAAGLGLTRRRRLQP